MVGLEISHDVVEIPVFAGVNDSRVDYGSVRGEVGIQLSLPLRIGLLSVLSSMEHLNYMSAFLLTFPAAKEHDD
jgi:hypothetical protein